MIQQHVVFATRCRSWLVIFFTVSIALIGATPGKAVGANIAVPGDYATIQEAIDAASDGDSIDVAAGTYVPTTTIRVDKEVTLLGAGSDSTTIDVGNYNAWGIYITADNVQFSGFTIQGDAASNQQYPVKVGSSNNVTGARICENVTLDDLVVQGGQRSGIDLNGVSGGLLNNISSTGATSGFGLSISSSIDITVSDLTTSSNAWGDVAVFPANTAFQWPALEAPAGIVFTGTLALSAGAGAIAVQDGALVSGGTWSGSISTDPAALADVTVPATFSHRIDSSRTGDGLVSHLATPGAIAGLVAQYLVSLGSFSEIVIQDMINEDFEVVEGLYIQDAIDAATDGDTINIAAGTYTNGSGICHGPQLYAMSIDKELTVAGAGDGTDPASNTVFAPASCGGQASNGVIFIDATDDVVLSGLYIDAQVNLDSGTGQEYARGLQTAASGTGSPIDNLLVEDVTISGTSHSCFEFNYTTNSIARNVHCDRSNAGYNGGTANGYRLVASTDFLLENATASTGASSYYLVSFQDHNTYTLRNVTLAGGAADYGQYLYMPYNFHETDKLQAVTYENVAIADVPTGIHVLAEAGTTITLSAAPGELSFTNVDVPLWIDNTNGASTFVDLQAFTCNSGLDWMVEDDGDGSQRWFQSEADASAWAGPMNCVGNCTWQNTGCCGDGTVNPTFEQCDDGDGTNGTFGSCCEASCTFEPAATLCRNDAGQCDVADYCSGASDVCADSFEPNTTTCTGSSQGDVCDNDASDLCSGVANTCVDAFQASSVTCRAATGQCDVAEECTGSAGACPSDAFQPNTTPCTGASQGDACDLDPDDRCLGTADTCVDAYQASGYVCRGGSGDPNSSGFTCDPDEVCNGNSGACPADTVSSAGTVCNAGSGDPNGSGFICDPDEVCSGIAGEACPVDGFSGDTVVCNAGGGDPNGSGFICDPDELCPGVPDQACAVDTFSGPSVVCNSGSGNPNGGSVCDPDEYCVGSADTACPSDIIEPVNTECREAIGECDNDEVCSGVADDACGTDVFFDDGLSCYTDPYIEDAPNREAPVSPLPCVNDECLCESGLCVAPNGFAVSSVRVSTSKPGKSTGKARVKGLVLDDATEGDFIVDLLADTIAVTITDQDGSFSVSEVLSGCESTGRNPNKPIYKCAWAGGKATFKALEFVPNTYDVTTSLKRIAEAQTGTEAIDLPLRIAFGKTSFYRVDRTGSISTVCRPNKTNTRISCRVPAE
ncbi:MAG: glycosyl hydrolase family 28-related protein [Candidatus Binatia bacterium]|nr:glycosyl hydrolase family 28-related protein [Candidatus Binatia bacterium]MDG2009649.1 glycosyl hydrolase family 28-related protein [Candidatus Binatia bacterium]